MKITNRIHQLRIDFSVPVTPEKSLRRFVNSLIIFCESITLIDCGIKGSYAQIYEYIKQYKRQPEEIKTLKLSHSHPDHIGTANRIKNDTGCRVIGHSFEQDWIEDIDLQYKMRPVPGFYSLVDESVEFDEVAATGYFFSF
jgi:hydroxyacylglutathione hydrolase